MTKPKGKRRLTKKPALATAAVQKARGTKCPGPSRDNEETIAIVEPQRRRISKRLSLKRTKYADSLPVSCESSCVFTSEPTPTGTCRTSKKKKNELKIEQTNNNISRSVETDGLSSKKARRSKSREDQAKLVATTGKTKTTSAVEQTVKTENEGQYEKMLAGLQSVDPLPSTRSEVLRDEKSDVHMMNSFVMKYVHPNEELVENVLKDPVAYAIRNSLMERSQTFDHASQVQACLDKVAWENTLMKGFVATFKSVDKVKDELIASLKADNQRLHNVLNEERSRFCVDWRNRDAERLVEETRKSAEEQNFYLKEQVQTTIDNLKSQYDNQLKELDEDRKKLAAENDSIHRRNERQRRVVEQLKKDNEGYSKSSKLLSKYFSIMQWMLVRVTKDLQKSDTSVRTGFDFQLASLTSSLMDSLTGNGTNKTDFELSEVEELGVKRLFESMKSKIKQKVKPSDLRNFIKRVENQTCHEYMSDTEVVEREEENLQRHTQVAIPDVPQDLVPSKDSIKVPEPFLALVDHGERDTNQATNNFDRDVGIMSETDDESTEVAPGTVTTNTDNQEHEQSTAISGLESRDTEILADDNIVPARDKETYSNRNADCSDLNNEVGVKAEKEDKDTPVAPVAPEEATRMNFNDCQDQEQNSVVNNQIVFEPCPSSYYEFVENSAPCFETEKESVGVSENSTVDLADILHAAGFELTNNEVPNSEVYADNTITTSPQNKDPDSESALNLDYAKEDSGKNIEQNTSDNFVALNEDVITSEEMNTLLAHASGISEGIDDVGVKGNTRNTVLSSIDTAEHTELDEDQEKHATDVYDTSNKLLTQDLQLSESDDSSEDDASDTCMTMFENDSERSFSEYEKEDMIKKAKELRLIPAKLQKSKSENDNSASKSGLGVSSHEAKNAVEPIAISSRLPPPPKQLGNGSSLSQKNNSTSSIQLPARQKRIPNLPGFPVPQTRSLSIAEKSTHLSVKNRLSRSCQSVVVPVNKTSNLCKKKRFVVSTSTKGKPSSSLSAVISQQQTLPQHSLNPEVQGSFPFVPVPRQVPQLPPNFMEMVNQVVQNTLSQMLYQNSSNGQMPTSIPEPFSRPGIPSEASYPDTPTLSSSVSNTLVLTQTNETCELGADNQENYDSPISPSAEMQMCTTDEQRQQIFSNKEWQFLEKPESCMIKSWCSRFLAELCDECDKDVTNGEFEKIHTKFFAQLSSMDPETSGNVYVALASQMYYYVSLRDPADIYDSEKPAKDDYVKLATIMRKLASKNYPDFDFSKLPELVFEFFEKQVMPNRSNNFGTHEDFTLNELGRFYSHLGTEFNLQSRAVDLLLLAVYYRPPHAFSLAVGMFINDLPLTASSDFYCLPLKLKCVLYCLLAPMRFKDAKGYAKLRAFISSIQFKVILKPYKQFVTMIIDELKELESLSALKEGCKCLGALLMQQNPEENIQFIGELMASVTRDWQRGAVNHGLFANLICSIGRVFGDTMDSISTEVLHGVTALFESLIKDTKDSNYTNKAARETLHRVQNRLKTKPNSAFNWIYEKNRHENPGGQINTGQKKKFRKHRKTASVSPGGRASKRSRSETP